MDRPVGEPNLAIDPGERVLAPVLVVAVGIVLVGVGAAALLAGLGAFGSRLVSSSVSMRSEFQIIDRSVTRRSSAFPATSVIFFTPCASVSSVRNTAASSCMVFCISRRSSAVGTDPLAWRSQSKRSSALSTLARLSRGVPPVRSTTAPARIAAARPNTTRSISEFEPSRLAPWTEAQPASPTAISPGAIRSGSSSLGFSTSPQ